MTEYIQAVFRPASINRLNEECQQVSLDGQYLVANPMADLKAHLGGAPRRKGAGIE